MKKLRWGILSTAKIGVTKVIPALQRSTINEVVAIASRSGERAEDVASRLNIPNFYDRYEALLADPTVDAIYNPLPNHLHEPWTIKALEAGKHVLCEKPIGLTAAEAERIMSALKKFPTLRVMEAFMYRFHPQWIKAKQLVVDDIIGEVKTVQSFFSYYNVDPTNIRNQADIGGGGMMDIGCYCVSVARFIFDSEPIRVRASVEIDPKFKTDTTTSCVMEFPNGSSTFTCSTQLSPYQRVNIVGTTGRIEIEIPFNAPPDTPTRLWLSTSAGTEEINFDVCDQYTLQADAFAKAVMHGTDAITPIEDALHNMQVIEAVLKSGATNAAIEL